VANGQHKAIGVMGSDALAHAFAQRLVARGRRVLAYMTLGAPRPPPSPALELVATPTDIAFECDILLSAIDDTALLRTILFGTTDKLGLGAEMMPGSILIDFGVRPPRETHAFLGALGTRGVAVVDASLIGGASAIAAGDAKILAGGFPDAVDGAMASLELIGRVDRTGALGSAHTAAALMGYVEAAEIVAREQAVSVGRAFGLSPETLARVFDGHPSPTPDNVARLTRRTDLAHRLASDRSLASDVIDFTRERLARSLPESGS
jgi:3-hydroxyisobutyrate dehydrogenase